MFGRAWELGKESVASFINDEALSRGAAIAFYTVTSIGPLLLIAVAIAGLAFGQDAARGAIINQLSGLMGQQSAELLQNVSGVPPGILRYLSQRLGSGHAFGDGLRHVRRNAVRTERHMEGGPEGDHRLPPDSCSRRQPGSRGGTWVPASGLAGDQRGSFRTQRYINAYLPFGHLILQTLNFLISFALISVLFAAIYKVLPDKDLEWRDVLAGAVVTAFLFSIGKFLIGLYIGSSAVASSYGAAGALSWRCYGSTTQRRFSCSGPSSLKSMPAITAASSRCRKLRT